MYDTYLTIISLPHCYHSLLAHLALTAWIPHYRHDFPGFLLLLYRFLVPSCTCCILLYLRFSFLFIGFLMVWPACLDIDIRLWDICFESGLP